MKPGFRSIESIFLINIGGEMTYPIQTINLVANTVYTLTTTISSALEIFNVLADYGGADSEVDVTWAIVGGVWVIYLTSVESLVGVKVKIIYK